MSGTTLEAQMFAHARPGTSDTSAIATDQVHNPGTMNAIINTKVRPTFPGEKVIKWRKVGACAANDANCWCEPDRDGKCWQAKHRDGDRASHPQGRRGLDRRARGDPARLLQHRLVLRAVLDESPDRSAPARSAWPQLRPDAVRHRPVPARLPQLPRDRGPAAEHPRLPESQETDATDLARRARTALRRVPAKPDARLLDGATSSAISTVSSVPNAVARGQEVFAATCARCHSSIPETAGGAFKNRDFRAPGPNGMRADWMGSDQATLASEVGTNRCRALHSNHMTGHIWEEYGSETLRARAAGSQHQGAARRRPRLLPQHFAAVAVGARAVHAQQRDRSRALRQAGEPGERLLPLAVRRCAQARRLPPTRRLHAGRTTRASTGASSSTSLRWRTCSIPASACRKMSRFDKDVRIALGPRTWDGSEEKQVFGFTLVLPAGNQCRRHGELSAQGVRQRPGARQAEARRARPPGS